MPALVANDRGEQGLALAVAAATEPVPIGFELLTPSGLAAMDERQETHLAQAFEQVLGVRHRKAQGLLTRLETQFRRPQGEHPRVPRLVDHVPKVEGAPLPRRGGLSRRRQVKHAPVLGERKAEQLSRAVPRDPPHNRIDQFRK